MDTLVWAMRLRFNNVILEIQIWRGRNKKTVLKYWGPGLGRLGSLRIVFQSQVPRE